MSPIARITGQLFSLLRSLPLAASPARRPAGADLAMSATWRCTLSATVLIGLVIGSRSAFGLFVSPINSTTGIGLAAISLAAAAGQLSQGLAQPLVGMLADRHGAARVITVGALGFAVGTAMLALVQSAMALGALMLFTAVAGTAMGSIAMLLGEIGRRVPAERQALVVGIVGAGGSAGQLLLGPATQAVIALGGWELAVWGTAALGLLAIPLSLAFRHPATAAIATAPTPTATGGSGSDNGVRAALSRPSFWFIALGFGVCGFHVSFLTMHMPGVIESCGLPAALSGVWLAVLGVANIAGSIAIGFLLKRYQPAVLLTALHALRALFIVALIALPSTPAVMLGFAVAMGLTYMAVLPPTSMLVAQRFGASRLGTLFGIVMLVHQVGSFTGVWLGGLAAEVGVYRPLWLIDTVLALLAAGVYFPFWGDGLRRGPVAATMAATVAEAA